MASSKDDSASVSSVSLNNDRETVHSTPPPPYESPSEEDLNMGQGATGVDPGAFILTNPSAYSPGTPPPYTPLYYPPHDATPHHQALQVSCNLWTNGTSSYTTSCLPKDATGFNDAVQYTAMNVTNPAISRDTTNYAPLLLNDEKARLVPEYTCNTTDHLLNAHATREYACVAPPNLAKPHNTTEYSYKTPLNPAKSCNTAQQLNQQDYGSHNMDELLGDEESVMLRNEFAHCKDWNTGKYLFISFVTCLCCSPIFGCVAIIFSLAAHYSADMGDVQEARMRGRIAIACCIIGAAISITCFSLYLTSCCSKRCSIY